jgi:sugar phosphate isomerase/epimerase
MNLAVSNIAWAAEHDETMYRFLHDAGFTGVEIAPTRIFPHNPYSRLDEAREYARMLQERYGLTIPSMQSIWYGKTENIFASEAERDTLIAYTKQAILFAEALGCGNLVFGCPRNRNVPDDRDPFPIALAFFREIGEYAREHHTVIAIEPNPPIYATNFINTTVEAFTLCEQINSDGVKVNVDTGTMLYYGDTVASNAAHVALVNHIHLSEPNLAPLEQRDLYRQLLRLAPDTYPHWFSIEMKNTGDLAVVQDAIRYIGESFA